MPNNHVGTQANHVLSFRAKRSKIPAWSGGIRFFFALALTFIPVSAFAQSSPARPRILGVSQIEFFSTNKSAAGAFFSAALESECSTKAPCLWSNVAQATGEFNFQKSSADQRLRLVASPEPAPSNLLREVTFSTDNVEALKKYLQANSIAIARSGKNYLGISDPDGHEIGFLQSSKAKSSSATNNLRIIHAGFIVRDRAAAEHFYKDILGFRPYWHGGMKDDQTDWISLQVPDGTDWVELMVNVSPDADQRVRGIMNHIALGVLDIHEAQKQLLKDGVHLTEEPKIGRDGKWQLNVYDPDQTRIEFMEFTPKEKPCCSEFTGPHPKP